MKQQYHTLIIGTGCAGFNAADKLFDLGVTDIAIVTEGRFMGTSRNTGSDKQTYYKLSLCSSEQDSVRDMAQSLFDAGCVNGDTAYIESANSARCFIKLANLGVEFPTNRLGEFVGYRTDHSTALRATSAGPLTSKMMTEALENSVKSKNIPIYDNTLIFKLVVKDNRICGALGFCKGDITAFECRNIILATGGPAGIYEASVFPASQTGMSSLGIEAGAETANLCEWQYGLASVDFRWNVSGTYQQVIPKYISVDGSGIEREFLLDYLDETEAANLIFLKGYEWPFDSAKTDGSSKIDMLVYEETVIKGRKVYMDFRTNPSGFDFYRLSDEAYSYLENSGALLGTPIKRLEHMNPKAIKLYADHGIDLYNKPLRIAVCAQHNNGGLAVDGDWCTSVSGLYAAGEVAGTFGITRPGGSALNSTQVGSLRSAEHIRYKGEEPLGKADFQAELDGFFGKLTFCEKFNPKIEEMKAELKCSMSKSAAFIRDVDGMKALLEVLRGTDIFEHSIAKAQLKSYLKLRDMIITSKSVLSAMIFSAENIGTRGGAIVKNIPNKGSFKDMIIATNGDDVYFKPVRPLPQSDTWFENVWNDYLRRRNDG